MNTYHQMKALIISVLYVDENEVYSLCVNDMGNNMLVHYNLAGDASSAVRTWLLRSLYSKNGKNWVGHFDSLITGLNTDPRNLPVNGFMSTSLNTIKSYNNFCDGSDLYQIDNYKSVWWLKDKNVFVGAFDRIEIHSKSCGKEKIEVYNMNKIKVKVGRDDDARNYSPYTDDSDLGELGPTTMTILDYTEAGTDPLMRLGDWEKQENFYWRCKTQTSLLEEISFDTVPKFTTKSPVNYVIGSGPLSIEWDDTWTASTGCSVNLRMYKVGEKIASVTSNNLGLKDPEPGDTSFSV